jgi:hypothetical protein
MTARRVTTEEMVRIMPARLPATSFPLTLCALGIILWQRKRVKAIIKVSGSSSDEDQESRTRMHAIDRREEEEEGRTSSE